MVCEQMRTAFAHLFISIFHRHFERTVNGLLFNVRQIRVNIKYLDVVEL